MKKLGMNAIYFSPVFESDTHGYNTRDYHKIDCRLGTNADFAEVCRNLHENGIKVILDGVFNHVGRGFWAFQDVLQKRWDSPYKDWFHINFDGNSNYNDGLWYEGWEGNYDLVKLNLRHEDVIAHIFDSIKGWVEEFAIDGLRLDVAYCLDKDFLRRLRSFCDGLKPDFYLLGETLHGDYNQWMNDAMLHSVTNYECYKGLFSSFNSMNMFEIVHSLLRQFGPENWTLYRGKHLRIDGYKHTFVFRFSLEDTLLIGQYDRTETAVIKRLGIFLRLRESADKVAQFIPCRLFKTGSERRIAFAFLCFCSPFAAVVYTGNSRTRAAAWR